MMLSDAVAHSTAFPLRVKATGEEATEGLARSSRKEVSHMKRAPLGFLSLGTS